MRWSRWLMVVNVSVVVGCRVAQNEAALAKARAELELARRRLEWIRPLAEQAFVPRDELETAETNVRVSEAQVALAEAEVEAARIQLSYTRIRAPIDGFVASVSTQEGETVAASMATPTFVTIIDLDRLEVQTYVDETDNGRIRVGQQVRFSVDAYPGEEFEGVVTAIYPEAVTQDNVVNYVVPVEVTDRGGRLLRPEMTAAVTILIEPRTDVLAVPAAAVGRDRSERYVTVLGDGTPTRRPVTVGWTQDGWTEIASGLTEGGRVVIPDRGGGP